MKEFLLLSIIGLFICIAASAQKSPVYTKNNKAINGYDPVAYFTESKPVLGKAELVYLWNGANWHFSTKENLESFKANPGKYAPQYGGYCAYGCSEGHKASTSPDAWTIIDGKLYLNNSAKVREYWNKNRPERIMQADKNWPEIKNKE